ncbi:MAG: phosphoglucosamine mutase, partial [Actinomycetota bacterium]
DAVEDYIDHLVDLFGSGTLAGMRIAVDTAKGAMSVVAPAVLNRLGADVVVLNDAPTGLNINDGCGATAPQSLCEFVAEAHDGLDVDIAFAFDGDGDRVIAVDENGKVVDGDRLIALSALERLGSGTLIGGTVVVTVMTNLGFHRAMHAAGIDVVTTPVGDRSVLQEMESNGYVIGGEQSGHIIHRDLATTGDGLLAAIVLARMVRRERAANGRPFSDIAAAVMTNVPQVLRAVPVATKPIDVEVDLAESLVTARGRLGERGRILVRKSGTEPVVRVMVEADDADMADEIAQELVSAVVSRWGGREPAP